MTLLPRVIGLIQGPPESPIELHFTNPYPTPTPTHTSLLYVILCSTCMIVPWYRPVTRLVKLPGSLRFSMQVAGTEGRQTSNTLWTLPRFILPAVGQCSSSLAVRMATPSLLPPGRPFSPWRRGWWQTRKPWAQRRLHFPGAVVLDCLSPLFAPLLQFSH